MNRVLSILLISITNCLLVTAEQCKLDGSEDCHIFTWRSWGSCNGVCGHQKQQRERVFCCDANLKPHNIDNCLKHCNLLSNFERFQNKTCRVCEHNGTLISVSSPCKCSLRYKGDCCQGRNNFSVFFILVVVWCFISNKNAFFSTEGFQKLSFSYTSQLICVKHFKIFSFIRFLFISRIIFMKICILYHNLYWKNLLSIHGTLRKISTSFGYF